MSLVNYTGKLTASTSTSAEVSSATKWPWWITIFWTSCCTKWNISYFFSKICMMIVSHWLWYGAMLWNLPVCRTQCAGSHLLLRVGKYPTLATWKPPLSKGEAKNPLSHLKDQPTKLTNKNKSPRTHLRRAAHCYFTGINMRTLKFGLFYTLYWPLWYVLWFL